MKKAIIVILALLLSASLSWGAGSCTQTEVDYPGGLFQVKLTCTDSNPAGTFTHTVSTDVMNILKGHYFLYQVKAYPTSGGTAPDAADVTVNMDGMDLLGAKGTNLLHATATQDTMPYSAFMSAYRYPPITNTVTLTLTNQATASANYTFELIFLR